MMGPTGISWTHHAFCNTHLYLIAFRSLGLTLAGNRRARRVLVQRPGVRETLRVHLEGLPKTIRDIVGKAQVRLCGRYRRLNGVGRKLLVVIVAIVRIVPLAVV